MFVSLCRRLAGTPGADPRRWDPGLDVGGENGRSM